MAPINVSSIVDELKQGDVDGQIFLLASILVASVVLVVVLYNLAFPGKPNDLKRLPGPRAWPIIGNLGLLGPLLHRDFAKLAKIYGPIFRLRLGSVDAIVVSSPDMAKAFLRTHDHVFASRPRFTQGIIMAYNQMDGATTPYGPYSRFVKKIMTLELMSATRLQEFQRSRKEEVTDMLNSILEDSKGARAVGFTDLMEDFMKNVMTQMAFSKKFLGQNSGATEIKESTGSFVQNIRELMRLFSVFCAGDYIPLLKYTDIGGYKKQMRAVVRKNDIILDRIIDEHRQALLHTHSEELSQSEKMDVVDVLLTRPAEGKDGKLLTNDQIKAILLSILAGGTDTSALTLEWAMAELFKHPAAMKRAQDELDAVVGKDRLVEEADSPNLQYVRAIMMETLRLHPPAPTLLPHHTKDSCEVAGYLIPANSLVFVNAWALGRDPATWERATEFEPERFLASDRKDFNGQDFEYLPFGSGRRICPGRPLAFIIVQYALAAMLQAFNWDLPPGVDPQGPDFNTETPGLTISRAIPLKALASPRLPLAVINNAPL